MRRVNRRLEMVEGGRRNSSLHQAEQVLTLL